MAGPISVPAAIIIGLVTSFIQSLGLTIQRKSHIQNAEEAPQGQSTEWKRPMWVFGFVIFLVANIGGTVFQIGALPIVMLAPLGAVSLLYNALLARFLLDDFFSKYMLVGTALIVVGAVLIGYFGVVQEPNHSLDDLLALYARPTFVVFATLFTLGFIGILAVAHLAEWQLHVKLFRADDLARQKKRHIHNSPKRKGRKALPRRWSAPSLAPVAEVSESTSGIATPVLAIADEATRRGIPVERVLMQRGGQNVLLPVPSGKNMPVASYGATGRARGSSTASFASSSSSCDPGLVDIERRSTSAAAAAASLHDPSVRKTCLGLAVAYGGASGTLSGACLLLAKSGVELLVLTLSGENQFDRWQSWFLVIVMFLAALLQLWYLNKSLRLASPPLVCPLAFCFYNTSSIALGLVYFDQIGALSGVSITLVIIGIVVLLAGVWMVSLHGSDTDANHSREEERQPLLSDVQEIVSSPTNTPNILSPPTSSHTESSALLANAGGIAGPHLPIADNNGASGGTSTSPSQSPVRERSSPEQLSPRSRRALSRSGNGSAAMGGLGLHMPGLPHYSSEDDIEALDGPEECGPSNDDVAETGNEGQTNVKSSKQAKLSFLPKLRVGSGTPASQLFSPPSLQRRGMYQSLLERGLSIGLSPSSPGFHVASTFELGDEADDGQEARRLWKQRLTSRRTFSENDTSLASARQRERHVHQSSALREEDVSDEDIERQTNGHASDDEAAETASIGSAWTRVIPTLDMQTLNDRLRRIKNDAGGWLGTLRGGRE